MPKTPGDLPDQRFSAGSAPRGLLDGIPLPARVVFYYAFFLTMILLVVPRLADWAGERLLPWHVELGAARWAGWALFAAAFVLYTLASYVLTSRGRGAYVEFDPPREFVATGPFRYCRNPIAACVLAMLLGLALAHSSTGILLLFLAATVLGHAQVVLLEEPLLRKRFGERYEAYRRTVPRWIPRPPREVSS